MEESFNIRKEDISSADRELDKQLRPASFTDFKGQQQVIDNLTVFVTAAKQRGETLDHVLLHGPPGLGKTLLEIQGVYDPEGTALLDVQGMGIPMKTAPAPSPVAPMPPAVPVAAPAPPPPAPAPRPAAPAYEPVTVPEPMPMRRSPSIPRE